MAKRGLPEKFEKQYVRIAERACALGATDVQLADMLEVHVNTIGNWRINHPEFAAAMKAGKEAADDHVERSLYHKATGYTFESEKIFNNDGMITRVPYREHIPPSDTAIIWWLKNRRPDLWRDRHEITGKGGGPIETRLDLSELTEDERNVLRTILGARAQETAGGAD